MKLYLTQFGGFLSETQYDVVFLHYVQTMKMKFERPVMNHIHNNLMIMDTIDL
jgi:hypothetical protein